MTLRDDLRDYFEREARRLPAPASLRVDVTARAAEPPAAVPQFRLAAVLAVLLAGAIIAGLLAASQIRHNQTVVPGRVHVRSDENEALLSIDLTDSQHAWALIEVCDKNVVACQYWVESYHDRREGWFGAIQVGPSFPASSGDAPRTIHFADRNNGFVYGLGVVFVTHDGGRSWSQMLGSFSDVIAIVGSQTVWMVMEPCVLPAVCPLTVRTSIDGGRTWADAASLPVGFEPDKATDFGSSGLLLGSPLKGDMAITKDGGHTWRLMPGRCSPANTVTATDSTDGNEIWELCGAPVLAISVSVDGGATWSLKPPVTGLAVAAAIFSSKPGIELLAASSGLQVPILFASTDRGASWREVPTARGLYAMYFSADLYGLAFDGYGRMYESTDYGFTWTRLAAAP